MRVLPLAILLAACTGETPDDKTDGHDSGTPEANTNPTISILSPADGAEMRAGEVVTFTAQIGDEESAADALEVTWTSTLDGTLVGSSSVAGDVASFVVTGGVSEGGHTVVATVTDEGGLTATDQVTFYASENEAPTITISAPITGSSHDEGDTVQVIVHGTDDFDDPEDVILTWGGDAVDYAPPDTLDATGSASFYMTDLQAGTRTVRVTATDSSGATDSDEIFFEVAADSDGDGYTENDDCDDADATIHPGAFEVCDGLDQDCDDSIDESATDPLTWYADDDADGFGDAGDATTACDQPDGYVDDDTDCDDADVTANPDADELCDGADNDCDGTTDENTAGDATTWYADTDGDGYGSATVTSTSCTQPSGYVSDDTDCDDRDSAVNPGAAEVCDSDDNDCDGTTDESDATDASTWYRDADGDGYGTTATTQVSCRQPSGYVSASTDCDDTDRTVSPVAAETCDSEDDDCDGTVDDNATDATTFYDDDDGDGYGDASSSTASCSAIAGKVTNSGDCNDATATVSPAATEVCDSLDNDCDGLTDESSASDASTWYLDADGDNYGLSTSTSVSCTRPTGYASVSGDCNDSLSAVNPAASEYCNSRDDDCDGTTDENSAVDATTWYRDADGDSYGVTTTTSVSCTRPTGYAASSTDCDDGDLSVHPGATETCDSDDEDCDGYVDESPSDGTTYYDDDDLDGYGDSTSGVSSCTALSGKVLNALDCNDAAYAINPAATERCDSVDNDCDGTTDESSASDASTWYRDVDGDGYGVTTTTTPSCTRPTGYASLSTDCDDTTTASHPGASEVCDSADNDCDGTTDESATDATTWYLDSDGDGYGVTTTTSSSCTRPTGYSAYSTDCNDASATISPAGTETCDSVDQDCDGTVDDNATDATTYYLDHDGDGYGVTTTTSASCSRPTGYVTTSTDCNDSSAAIYPGATESCDGLDNDCDLSIDEEVPTWYRDADADGYGNPLVFSSSCTRPSSYVSNDDDCDDGDANISPAEDEVCGDGDDNDCDGLTDDSTATDATEYYADSDSDTYGDPDVSVYACTRPTGYVSTYTDCDDTDADTNPAADERCDGIDNDCDGTTEEGFAVPADYSTISAAVTAASSGDVICVSSGTYYAPINYAGKNITIEGEGSGVTYIDVNGGRITMTNGSLIGVTVKNGSQASAAALQCSTAVGTPYLEDVEFKTNTCTSVSACTGIVYLSSCAMEMVDVEFDTNTVNPSSGTVTGGLLYAYNSDFIADGLTFTGNTITAGSDLYGGLIYLTSGSDPDITDLVVTSNTITGSSTIYQGGVLYGSSTGLDINSATITSNTITMTYGGYGGMFYFTGSSAPDLDYMDIWTNTVRGTSSSSSYPMYGGLMYFTTSADANMWWNDWRNNTITGYYIYGGLVSGTYLSDPEFVQFIVAGNRVTASTQAYGGLFDLRAYTGTSSSYSLGSMRFADIAGNTVTGGTVYGGMLDGDYYYTSSSNISGTSYSTGWDMDMVNIVNNTVSGTYYGSVYYDDSSSYSPYTDWDYCNTYNNTGTDFYYFTDPSGSSGNVNYDPSYVDVSLSSAIYWDLSLSSTSSVRNAGNPSSTYYDPDGTYAAIGAYGGPYADDW